MNFWHLTLDDVFSETPAHMAQGLFNNAGCRAFHYIPKEKCDSLVQDQKTPIRIAAHSFPENFVPVVTKMAGRNVVHVAVRTILNPDGMLHVLYLFPDTMKILEIWGGESEDFYFS